ncbi:MAG: tetratricopeptide repeat protein, partial [Alphaproteobacteria bacterium]|nr:tetratricopeptide repeat protein [Alphaproteobacteria bacterium]
TIRDFPSDVVARCGLAETQREMGRLPEALESYRQTIRDFPDNTVARCGLAETLRNTGRLPEALKSYRQTIRDFPGEAVARNDLAETLRDMGRLPEALESYQQTIRDFPDNGIAQRGYVTTLVESGRPKEARDALATTGTPPQTIGDWIAAHILCVIDLKEGMTHELIDRLQGFIESCPHHRQRKYFQSMLAVVRIREKQLSKARTELNDLIDQPEFSLNERNVLHLIKAHTEAADGRLRDAADSLADAARIVSRETFLARRMRHEIERRFALGGNPSTISTKESLDAESNLIHMEMSFWAASAAQAAEKSRKAA